MHKNRIKLDFYCLVTSKAYNWRSYGHLCKKNRINAGILRNHKIDDLQLFYVSKCHFFRPTNHKLNISKFRHQKSKWSENWQTALLRSNKTMCKRRVHLDTGNMVNLNKKHQNMVIFSIKNPLLWPPKIIILIQFSNTPNFIITKLQ